MHFVDVVGSGVVSIATPATALTPLVLTPFMLTPFLSAPFPFTPLTTLAPFASTPVAIAVVRDSHGRRSVGDGRRGNVHRLCRCIHGPGDAQSDGDVDVR